MKKEKTLVQVAPSAPSRHLGGTFVDLNQIYARLLTSEEESISQAHDYYKLREMQVNKRLIVEKQRKDGKWKDITPEDKNEKIKAKAEAKR